MLVCYVNSRRHPPRLPRPCRGAFRDPSSLLSPFRSSGITLVQILLSRNSLRCNTYAPPRKCCKQKTYGPAKPFRCNTYKKQGEGVPIMVNQVLETNHLPISPLRVSASLWLPRLPFSVHTSKFRIPQLLCLPFLRKLQGCTPKVPKLEQKGGSGQALKSNRGLLQVGGRGCILAVNPKAP
jgi:hypothetical protein